MSDGHVRHLHKLMNLADQPGGLATMSDAELSLWISNRRAGLDRAEGDNVEVVATLNDGSRGRVEVVECPDLPYDVWTARS